MTTWNILPGFILLMIPAGIMSKINLNSTKKFRAGTEIRSSNKCMPFIGIFCFVEIITVSRALSYADKINLALFVQIGSYFVPFRKMWNLSGRNKIGTSYPKIATKFQSLYLAEIFALLL